jgi:hypothetical protein
VFIVDESDTRPIDDNGVGANGAYDNDDDNEEGAISVVSLFNDVDVDDDVEEEEDEEGKAIIVDVVFDTVCVVGIILVEVVDVFVDADEVVVVVVGRDVVAVGEGRVSRGDGGRTPERAANGGGENNDDERSDNIDGDGDVDVDVGKNGTGEPIVPGRVGR